ncbi:hypothetical protein PINS_up015189 [Pythium insidiosum]|nr:hypothetical protein PINS_up015189 [Pythium insidiosum]
MVLQNQSNDEVYVEAMAVGEVRGKATLSGPVSPRLFSGGQMHVSKILYGATKPYVTAVPASGHAELDWQMFYDISEQVPTRVRIDHAVDSDQLRCCGLTIQKMPDDAPHNRHYELEDLRFDKTELVTADIKDPKDVIEFLNELIPKADLTEQSMRKVPLDFFCRCSKKAFSSRLAALGKDQLADVIDGASGEGLDLTCHFCNEMYHFSSHELANIPLGNQQM